MKERIKALGEKSLEIRLWTLTDKKSQFRVSEPDKHCVEIIAKTSRNQVMIRDWWFDKPSLALAHYKHLIDLLK